MTESTFRRPLCTVIHRPQHTASRSRPPISSLSSSSSSSSSPRPTKKRRRDSTSNTPLVLLPFLISLASGYIDFGPAIVDETDCYNDLIDADADNDRQLDKNEFAKFVSLQTDGYFNGDSYDALPTELQDYFVDHAHCRDGSSRCDVDDLRWSNDGADENDKPGDEEYKYLFGICEKSVVLEDQLRTPQPTMSPSESPVEAPVSPPTPRPTDVPTPKPTLPQFIQPKPPSIPLAGITITQRPSAAGGTEVYAPVAPVTTPTGLGTGAVIGIAAAAFVAGFAAIAGLYTHRSRRRLAKDEVEVYDVNKKPTLGAAPPVYGPKASRTKIVPKGFSSLEDDMGSESGSRSRGGDSLELESQASSSQAGSSGWSSSAGMSSLNTGSVDSEGDNKLYGSSLAQMGMQSGIAAGRLREEYNANMIQFMPIQRNKEKPPDFDNLSDASDLLISASFEPTVPHPIPTVSRADLDSAIEAGDWAAVGATAALLATASDSLSSSTTPSRSTRSSLSELDAARAAELDHLVDNGDWEGVVLAAAKFERSGEADEFSKSLSSEGQTNSASDNFHSAGSSTGTGSTTYYSESKSVHTSPSTELNIDEIRAEVEALVRRVVPDEIDNVDEMMTQFRGREEELVETLRTMQERSIAQRARAAVHRNAKREARRAVRGEKSPFPPRPPGSASFQERQWQNASKPPLPQKPQSMNGGTVASRPMIDNDVNTVNQNTQAGAPTEIDTLSESFSEPRFEPPAPTRSNSSDTSSENDRSTSFSKAVEPLELQEPSESDNDTRNSQFKSCNSALDTSRKRKDRITNRTALEMAIEAGDWEAVGEAAAMMSDNSVTTASTDELRGIVEGDWEEYDTSTASFKSCSSINVDRAAELDRMIDKGDWSGVVAAASRFSSLDAQKKIDVRSTDGENKIKVNTLERISEKRQATSQDKIDNSTLGSEDSRQKNRALQEEKDALAQAEIWMAIAAQSKQEGVTEAKGASDAADWAISRSLDALNANQTPPRLLGATRRQDVGKQSTTGSLASSNSKGETSV